MRNTQTKEIAPFAGDIATIGFSAIELAAPDAHIVTHGNGTTGQNVLPTTFI
jgi:hypothetical protein